MASSSLRSKASWCGAAALLLLAAPARADGPPPPPCWDHDAGDACELFRELGTCQRTDAGSEGWFTKIACRDQVCLACVVPPDPPLADPPPARPRPVSTASATPAERGDPSRLPLLASAVIALAAGAFAIARRRRRPR